jgi:carboxylesterase type B
MPHGVSALVALSLLASAVGTPPRARVEAGILEGAVDSATGVNVFRGIPYAAPPVGDLRRRPPQPAARWTGVRQATALGKNCVQARVYDDIDAFAVGVSEDCLYLNVWTAAKAGDKRPVMVWIHGGGFQAGFGGEDRHDGGRLARKGVVVVTLNYRLGTFGFFGTGNYGILDQIAALEWVKRNIAAFGGDPKRVTIFGESAGGTSVGILIASPLAKGLFERAILESGTGLGLRPASAEQRSMQPVVAPPVLPHPVDSTLMSGAGNVVPVIVGNNADEDSVTFRAPARTFAQLMTARGQRVYRYVFARRGDEHGAYHSAEITFVFDRPRASGRTDYDSTLAETMSDYWVAFATSGDPNGAPGEGQRPLWPVYDPKRDSYLELGPQITVRYQGSQ